MWRRSLSVVPTTSSLRSPGTWWWAGSLWQWPSPRTGVLWCQWWKEKSKIYLQPKSVNASLTVIRGSSCWTDKTQWWVWPLNLFSGSLRVSECICRSNYMSVNGPLLPSWSYQCMSNYSLVSWVQLTVTLIMLREAEQDQPVCPDSSGTWTPPGSQSQCGRTSETCSRSEWVSATLFDLFLWFSVISPTAPSSICEYFYQLWFIPAQVNTWCSGMQTRKTFTQMPQEV